MDKYVKDISDLAIVGHANQLLWMPPSQNIWRRFLELKHSGVPYKAEAAKSLFLKCVTKGRAAAINCPDLQPCLRYLHLGVSPILTHLKTSITYLKFSRQIVNKDEVSKSDR